MAYQGQPGAQTATAAKPRAGDLPKGAVCTGVRITPSDNGGFVVEHSYQAPRGKGKEDYPRYIEPRTHTFEGRDAMLAHVEQTFGGEEYDGKDGKDGKDGNGKDGKGKDGKK